MLRLHSRVPAVAAVLAIAVMAVAGCSSSSSGPANPGPATASQGAQSSQAAGQDPTSQTGGGAGPIDGCTLLSAADLSQAAGVSYTAIQAANGSSCNVTGASAADSFDFSVTAADATNTWAAQVATINSDDGSSTAVSGVGDQAVAGGVKEFAAEAKGYIVFVMSADMNNTATGKDFTRSKKIAQALIAKL